MKFQGFCVLFSYLMETNVTLRPSVTMEEAETEVYQLVKEIVLQIVSNVVNTLDLNRFKGCWLQEESREHN